MTDIRPTSEWKESPFQFGLFPGSLSSNKKRDMAPVLVVEIEHKHVSTGLEFFSSVFDGDNHLSPCDIPYLVFMLYQNQLTDSVSL